MEKKPKLNKRLLNRVLSHIKSEPRRFNMGTFGEEVDKEVSPCGTQACIGGWAYLLTLSPKNWARAIRRATDGELDIQVKAQKVLGLTSEEAKSLFLTNTGNDDISLAKQKIDLLKKDRERFVRRYLYLG